MPGAPRNAVRDRPRYKRANRHQAKLKIGVDIPSPQEVSALLHHAPARWRPLLVAAAFTGLRASELRGLHWEDVDLKKGVLNVTRRADRYNVLGSPQEQDKPAQGPLRPRRGECSSPWLRQGRRQGYRLLDQEGGIVDHTILSGIRSFPRRGRRPAAIHGPALFASLLLQAGA